VRVLQGRAEAAAGLLVGISAVHMLQDVWHLQQQWQQRTVGDMMTWVMVMRVILVLAAALVPCLAA
jgi:hypothetical protein